MASSTSKKPVVAVTGLEGRENPYPGLSIAKALRDARGDAIKIIGLAYEPTLTGNFRDDLFDTVYLTPLPGDPAATLMKRLREINKECPIDLLIPALDSELALFSLHRQELSDMGIEMVIPSPESVKNRYKQRLPHWAAERGLHSPATEVVTDPKTFWKQEDWDFPCWLKGSLADAYRVKSQEEAEIVAKRIVDQWGYPVLAQKEVVGEEYDICAVVRPGGDPLAMITIRKTVLSAAGKAIGAVVVDDPEAEAAGLKFLAELDWEGPLELEMMREHSSGRYHLVEVNARFPAWIGMGPGTGLNLPDLLVRLGLGEDLPETIASPTAGTMFLRSTHTKLGRVTDLGDLLANGKLELQK